MPIHINKSVLIATIVSLIFSTFAQAQTASKDISINQKSRPKNIILLIGDGMGLAQMYAALTATQDNLRMTNCPNIALVKTFSDSDYITDSAAAGTAIATGNKTTNGMIGMLPDKTPVTSILKYAENHGLATGLVTTCDITHATPAAFIANVENRKMAQEIALQFLYTDIDVFIGGGYDNFTKRADSLNLIDSLLVRNYQIATTISEMNAINRGKLAALLYPKHPSKMSEGRGDMLPVSTAKALELLSKNENGFFLMVEGSQIDWGGHDNDLDYILNETIDFDKACGIALDFAEKNGETLIIITADHETGGLSLPGGELKSGKPEGKFSTGDHSAIPVPLYAKGPGGDQFDGLIDNTDIFKIMYRLFGFEVIKE
ncbi:MAG: alkaline phosphatase [Lentimicrobium sp.]|nr:alkaline phosphatase [Lentimicrobium sp.]